MLSENNKKGGMSMKTKTNIVASVKTPKIKFYVRMVAGGYNVYRDANLHSNEPDLNTAIARMLRMAYFETKQTELEFPEE